MTNQIKILNAKYSFQYPLEGYAKVREGKPEEDELIP